MLLTDASLLEMRCWLKEKTEEKAVAVAVALALS